jgi:segregation and condensation protein B
VLLEAGLIKPQGRSETPGRPTLWVTTPRFLAQFGLSSIRELPGAHLSLFLPRGAAEARAPAGEDAKPPRPDHEDLEFEP